MVESGSYISETEWSIVDCDGNVLASGAGAASSACYDLPDNYSVVMGDIYGDSWNGNVLTIGDTFSSEGPASGCESETESWDATYPENCFLTEYVGSCGVLGCTDATACNFDADLGATIDDGSCTYPAGAGVDCDGNCVNAVSYTHLTLPTKRIV